MKEVGSKSIHFFTYFLTASLVILIFNFCAEKKPTEPNELQTKTILSKLGGARSELNLSADSTKTKDKDKKKGGGGIGPNLPDCNLPLEKYYWELEKYIPVEGKRLGIWFHEDYWNNEFLNRIRNFYGFSLLAVTWPSDNNPPSNMINRISLCESVGFYKSTDLMEIIDSKNNIWVTHPAIRDFSLHYTDEPLDREQSSDRWSVQDLVTVSNSILGQNPTAKFLVGTPKNQYTVFGNTLPDYRSFINQTINSFIMYTDYESGAFNNINDQSSCWTYFDNYFGNNRVITQWIGLEEDYHGIGDIEYGNLLGIANDHGYNQIWLYAAGTHNIDRIDIYCGYAFQKRWLKRFERQYIYTYTCFKPNPCDCDRNNLTDGWSLPTKTPTQNTRIVTY